MKVTLFYTIVLLTTYSLASQNLLDLSSWNIGQGSVAGFSKQGGDSGNIRELGRNHIGKEVVLWKAVPSGAASHSGDGGFNTSYVNINNNYTYRFSVWIKKTNSNYGTTYFGFRANSSGSLKLDGTYKGNAYFFAGDLPKLNRWYLLVAYVHKSSHTGTANTGGIYDGTTGLKVRTITDYKTKNTATRLQHRAYLYYDKNTLDRQYFYEPRIDKIDGNESTIDELLKINKGSKIILTYDAAGNQTQNFYCDDPATCSPTAAKTETAETKEEIESAIDNIVDNHLNIYPNPTSGLITLSIGATLLKSISTIGLYNANSLLIKTIKPDSKVKIDLSNMPSGVYFIHSHVNGGKSITKKIIKN